MNFGLITSAFLMATGQPPLDTALARTEPPTSLRAAFTVELTDGEAFREVRFDPRLQLKSDRWKVISSIGESLELDQAVQTWGSEKAPDGWLIPDDLRASMGGFVDAEDMGELWRIEFEHQPSSNDGPIDVWASHHLIGYSWLEPVSQQFVRVEYEAPEAFDIPGGGHVESYSHSYILAPDPTYGVTFVAAYMIDVIGSYQSKPIDRSYRARITDAEFFFTSPVEEARFLKRQKSIAMAELKLSSAAE